MLTNLMARILRGRKKPSSPAVITYTAGTGLADPRFLQTQDALKVPCLPQFILTLLRCTLMVPTLYSALSEHTDVLDSLL